MTLERMEATIQRELIDLEGKAELGRGIDTPIIVRYHGTPLIIPTKSYNLTKESGRYFREVHLTPTGEICGEVGRKRYCKECGKEIEDEKVGRAFELSEGNLILLSDEEYQKIKEWKSADRRYELVGSKERVFIPYELVVDVFALEPDKMGEPAHLTMRYYIKETNRYLIVKGKQTKVGKERWGFVDTSPLPRERDILKLHLLRYPEEVRRLEELAKRVDEKIRVALSYDMGRFEQILPSGQFEYKELEDTFLKQLYDTITPKLLGKPIDLAEPTDVIEAPIEKAFGQAEVEIELPEELRSAPKKHKELYLLTKRLQGQYQEGVSLDVIVKESKSSESVAKIILTDLEEGYNQLIKTDKGYKTK